MTCHLCEWDIPNPDYKAVISDIEMLGVIAFRWDTNRKNRQENPEWYLDSVYIDTPDVLLAPKYTPEEIDAKMEELNHRGLLDYGVSLRTAWLSDKELSA